VCDRAGVLGGAWTPAGDLEADNAALGEKLPETYARRDDVALSRSVVREELIKINEKLDRLIERGAHEREKKPRTHERQLLMRIDGKLDW
jgi:hypothetical protein